MFRFKTCATTAVGGALAGSLLIVEPAHAQSTYEGRVTANGGLLVRHLPTTASAVEGKLSKGQQIEIICKVRGSSVNGNDLWYSLPPTLNEWVAARYVQDIGPASRWCGSSERFVGRATTALSKRPAPTTASAKVGSVARGAGVDIICKLEGQPVAGNNRWYVLTDHRWMTARYVRNVGRALGGATDSQLDRRAARRRRTGKQHAYAADIFQRRCSADRTSSCSPEASGCSMLESSLAELRR